MMGHKDTGAAGKGSYNNLSTKIMEGSNELKAIKRIEVYESTPIINM